MKKLIFALMIAIAVAANAPVNSQSTTTCGFNACTKSFEISVLTDGPTLAEFFRCYNAAWINYNGDIARANSQYWTNIRKAYGVAGVAWGGCRVAALKWDRFSKWIAKNWKKWLPGFCEAKALGAAGAWEILCLSELYGAMDLACVDLDIAVELCANNADRNYKKCDL